MSETKIEPPVEYPADVQAALEQVYRTRHEADGKWLQPRHAIHVEALQAALTIALAHLSEPGMPEPVVMLVEKGSTTEIKVRWWVEDSPLEEVTFEDDKIVVACPSCDDIGNWSYFEDGTEYRKFFTEELTISEDAEDFQGDGAFGLLCGTCSTRCVIPGWLYEAGCWTWDAPEWGGPAE